MKFGFSSVIFEQKIRPSIPELIMKASNLGYDGVELNFQEMPDALDLSPVKRQLYRSKVSISAIGTRHMLLTHGLFLASPAEEKRRAAIDYVKKCIELSKELRTDTIQLGWAFQGLKAESSKSQALRNVIDCLKEINTHLGKDTQLVLEPINRHDAPLVHTIKECLKLVDSVGSPRVLTMADTYHMNIEEASMEESLRLAGRRLGYVQFSDDNRLPPGYGHIDFTKILQTLKEMDYAGYVVMEFVPEPSPDRSIANAISLMRRILGPS